MNRTWALALLATACTDVFLTDGAIEVTASPGLLDLGEVPLGAEVSGSVSLSTRYGVGAVRDVNVLPTLGTGFVSSGPERFDIDPDSGGEVVVAFRPTEVGYASAIVEITTNDVREPVRSVEVRARGVEARLVANPVVLDLGVVPPGTTANDSVDLRNEGELGVVLQDALATRADVSVARVFPVTLPANGTFTFPVSYASSSSAPMQAFLSFVSGTAVVPDVVLVRANDCERGIPDAYDVDQDGVTSCGGDCNDADPLIGPGRPEGVNGIDDDCNLKIDDTTVVYDDDGDGFCEGPAACVGTARTGDCNDNAITVYPRAAELPDNGVDDDCDGRVDPGSVDVDRDGFGPEGGDCDDDDADVNPAATELPNGVDDDCDGPIDEDTVISDDDGDGFCEGPAPCLGGATPGDCHDGDATRHPNASEVGNWVDEDCDGEVDEGTERGDDDGDGFTELGGDCDDNDPLINPVRGGCP